MDGRWNSGDRPLVFAQIACACTWCLFSAGIIFGFAAFKPILVSEGVYSHLCGPEDPGAPCKKQDMRLNLIFTVGATVTNLMALPVGHVLDNYGPRRSSLLGALLLIAGSLVFIFGPTLGTVIDPYLTGYVLLAIAGPFVFISCFQLANAVPQRSGTVLALLTGSFDSSSALFMIYRSLYEGPLSNLSVSLFFRYYLAVPLFIIICQLTLFDNEPYKNHADNAMVERPNENDESLDGFAEFIMPLEQNSQANFSEPLYSSETATSIHKSDTKPQRRYSAMENNAETISKSRTGDIYGALHGLSVIDQIKSPWFYLMVIFSALVLTRTNYFISTIRTQEAYLLDDEELAEKINAFFDVALPIGGIIAIPIIGWILDSLSSFTALLVTTISTIIIGFLGVLPNALYLNTSGILLFVLYRPFFYTAVSDYSTKVFGFETFGTVYGFLICISGLVNISQGFLDKLTHETFNMNPIPINLFLLATTILSSISLLAYVKKQLKYSMELSDSDYEAIPTTSQSSDNLSTPCR